MTIPHGDIMMVICPDEYHIKHVGKTHDGHQIFITSCLRFEPKSKTTIDYIVAFEWDINGKFITANIVNLGKRGEYNDDEVQNRIDNLITNKIKSVCEITVKPCTVTHDGVVFGLIPRTDDGQTVVELMPGNCLSFTEPFDGAYDT